MFGENWEIIRQHYSVQCTTDIDLDPDLISFDYRTVFLFKKFEKITILSSLSFPGTVGVHTDGVSDQDPDSVGSVDPELIPKENPDPDILCFFECRILKDWKLLLKL